MDVRWRVLYGLQALQPRLKLARGRERPFEIRVKLKQRSTWREVGEKKKKKIKRDGNKNLGIEMDEMERDKLTEDTDVIINLDEKKR